MEEHNEGVSMARSLQEIRQHLAGEWLFENNFKDTSGNENDGTPINIEWTSTNRGLKPILNGSTAYIELDESYTFSSNHSLSFWMKMYPQDFLGIVSGVTGAYDYLRFGNSAGNFGNNIYGETSTDSDSLLLDFTGEFDTISMNTWYFFTVTQGDSNDWTLYINGVPNGTASTTDTNMIIKRLGQGRLGGDHFNGNFDKFYIHSTLLTEAETLALYNATSGEYGPSWAEKSYQHDPLAAIPEQTGTVLSIGGKLPGDAVDTISDRALSNDATIYGAMPAADNYFIGGRRYDGDDDNLNLGVNTDFNVGEHEGEDFCCAFMFKHSASGVSKTVYNSGTGFPSAFNIYISGANVLASDVRDKDSNATFASFGGVVPDVYNVIEYKFIDYVLSMYINGIVHTNTFDIGTWLKSSSGDATISKSTASFNGMISFSMLVTGKTCGVFNTLAVLPIFELNFRDYPDNPDAVWTDNTLIPFSSGVVGSNGTFSVDGDQLICGEDTSTCTFRNNFKLDGQEYVTVTINGIEYSGTGTITQGSVTVSITQGSNKITIAADDGDVIDKVRIRFREPVST